MAGTKQNVFDNYLRLHNAAKGETFTNTRIGDKSLSIFGGSYKINEDEWEKFMKDHYYNHVFKKGNMEYLTEKQLIENGPIMIDIDLRYEPEIQTKQHTAEHITDAVMLYADKISEIMDIAENTDLNVFVMEKENVNSLEHKTKDGIHIIIGLQMHKAAQVMLRLKVLPELQNMWDDLPIKNTWEDVLDEGITKGFVNWQMYGSRKPGNQAYMIKYHYIINYSASNNGWSIEKQPLENFSTEQNILKLSARYKNHPSFPLKEDLLEDFELTKSTLTQVRNGTSGGGGAKSAPKYKLKIADTGKGNGKLNNIDYGEIDSEATLDAMIEEMFNDLSSSNYRIKETHEYTMSLPISYYGPGSYTKWINVGMALRNTDHKHFLTWLKFSCQENCRDTLKGISGKFDWRCVSELYESWCKLSCDNPDGLTYRSILYWSKNEVPDKYNAILKETVDYFIEESIDNATDFDLASVLYYMYKDKFVCISIKHKVWYEYINHRWHEIDSGNTLRMAISKDMYNIYFRKINEINAKVAKMDQSDPKCDVIRKRSNKIAEICIILKKTQPKQNIMREAMELFYDKDFLNKLDKNPYLICFNNGVVDFKQKIHRNGQPDDFISKCTNIDYVPFNSVKKGGTVDEINEFMSQLFPVKELETYMWDHLSSCLIGVNTNQTFHIYKGSGRNGKSCLTSLMSKSMGTYKGVVPITLITQKRNSVGSTSSEVAQLDGIRYAVMQEPTKGDKINEGALKELTGGTDPIQGRALFKDTITFIPQFKLVVCTNTDFEDTSNDDGTWRRMRYIDFMSKFLDNPYEDEIKFPKSECPYQFPLNKKLEEKFDSWAPVFMSMLVNRTFEQQGIVNDCNIVLATSDKHRDSQDYLAGFVKEMIKKSSGSLVKKTELMEQFKLWYIQNHGKVIPKGKEVTEFMNHRYGVYKNGWHNIAINYDEETADDPLDEC